jgi:hypothetical protein
MVAEEYLSRSRLFRRLKRGPHGRSSLSSTRRVWSKMALFAMAPGGASAWPAIS